MTKNSPVILIRNFRPIDDVKKLLIEILFIYFDSKFKDTKVDEQPNTPNCQLPTTDLVLPDDFPDFKCRCPFPVRLQRVDHDVSDELDLFLRDALSPLLIGISIPTSILASFLFFYQFHIQLNIMSLGGLALGIGLLVDNSIIVLENIFRHHENGEDAVSASILCTDEEVLRLLASK